VKGALILKARSLARKDWEVVDWLRRRHWRHFHPNLPLVVVSDNWAFHRVKGGRVKHPAQAYRERAVDLASHYAALFESSPSQQVAVRLLDALRLAFGDAVWWREVASLSLGAKLSFALSKGLLTPQVLDGDRAEALRESLALLLAREGERANLIFLYTPAVYVFPTERATRSFKAMLVAMLHREVWGD